MKKGCIIGLAVLGIIVLALFGWVKNSYNGLVNDQEKVEAAWAQVENVYQRRADLIPNLVETVKGYAKHEQETLEGVIEARANATKVTIDPSNMTPEDLKKYQAAQGEITNALSRLIAVSESYPDLKANQNFLELQNQLEGTENRITVERNKFNEVAREYNTKRRTFPTNIIAGIFNFGEKPYFQAQEGADKAPKVDFGTSEGK
jgi:LemA protein